MSDPSSEEPTFTAPDVGQSGASLIFQLTVTDDGGLQSTDTCVVNVSWKDDVPPAPQEGPVKHRLSGMRGTVGDSGRTDHEAVTHGCSDTRETVP